MAVNFPSLVPNSGTKASDFAPDLFYIDIGADSKKSAERKVKIGDTFVLKSNLTKLNSSRVFGRPLDDRAGCGIVLELAKKIDLLIELLRETHGLLVHLLFAKLFFILHFLFNEEINTV